MLTLPYPAAEHPEPGAPDRIEHGLDYDLADDGSFTYHYNFLVYHWRLGSEEIKARHYLDESGTVSVFLPPKRLQTDLSLRPLLHYLLRRHSRISGFDEHAEMPYQLAVQSGVPVMAPESE